NPTDRVVDQGFELLPLLVRDGGPQVLDFNHALTDKDDLSDFIDAGHPGITNQLRIQGRNAVRLLWIAGGAGLPLQHTGCIVQFADRIDKGDKAVAGTQRACESNLLMAQRLVNLDAAVLGEALEQLNSLLQHVVPGVVARVRQLQVLTRRPLLKQDCRWIFATEQSRHRLLEAAAEKHGGAGVFFLPAIEVAMAVTARAGQVLGDLGVAVIHHDAFSFREPLPLPAGGTRTEVASSSHWLAGAKPSKFASEMPLTTVWLILTTPTKPRRARSSTSSWLNSSGSYRKSRRNQPSFHIAFGVQ